MLRRISYIVVVLFLFAAVSAEAARWKSTIADARAEAKAKNQLILVDMYAEWCGWCKKMAWEVFPSEAFQNGTRDLVLLKVDTEDGGEGEKLATDMSVQTLPTFLLLTHDMKRAGTIHGYAPAKVFVEQVRNAIDDWTSVQDRIAQEGRHAGDYAWRFALAKDLFAREDYTEAAKRLSALSTEKKLPAEMWGGVVYQLALAQWGVGTFDEAQKTIDRLMKKEKRGEFAEKGAMFRAQAFFERRDYKTALAELKRFQETYPESSLIPSVLSMMPVFERAATGQ